MAKRIAGGVPKALSACGTLCMALESAQSSQTNMVVCQSDVERHRKCVGTSFSVLQELQAGMEKFATGREFGLRKSPASSRCLRSEFLNSNRVFASKKPGFGTLDHSFQTLHASAHA